MGNGKVNAKRGPDAKDLAAGIKFEEPVVLRYFELL